MRFVLKDLSIIIVNYRSWEKLSQCLDSLITVSETCFSFEVIVVDNKSGDGIIGRFRQNYPQFSFITNTGNYGFAHANNLGSSIATGKYLLFLNPDTIVSEKALLAMLDQTKVSKANSVISCRQVRENGTEDKPYGVFPSLWTLTGWTRALGKLLNLNPNLPENKRFKSPEWVSGSVIMMSKASFNKIGRWNEQFWMYYEDVDLCRRATNAGGSICLLKNVSVVHNHGGSSRSNYETIALTKTEVNISRHSYISLHEKGFNEFLMHLFLICNHLLLGLLPAIPGLLLFFHKRLFGVARIYFNMVNYYLGVLIHNTWISPRSVLYPEIFPVAVQPDRNWISIGDDNSQRA